MEACNVVLSFDSFDKILYGVAIQMNPLQLHYLFSLSIKMKFGMFSEFLF